MRESRHIKFDRQIDLDEYQRMSASIIDCPRRGYVHGHVELWEVTNKILDSVQD